MGARFGTDPSQQIGARGRDDPRAPAAPAALRELPDCQLHHPKHSNGYLHFTLVLEYRLEASYGPRNAEPVLSPQINVKGGLTWQN